MEIFKPTLNNIFEMQALVMPFIKEGIVLKRDDDEVALNIRSYLVVKEDNKIVAIGALHIFNLMLGEIRSLVVDKKYQNKKIGKKLVLALIDEAKKLGLKEILVLTYKKEFFEKLGFVEIPKENIPDQKVWADCIKCKHFPNCNEISLIKQL